MNIPLSIILFSLLCLSHYVGHATRSDIEPRAAKAGLSSKPSFSLYRLTIGYFQHVDTSIINAELISSSHLA
jgi:hypothetical protein